MLIYKYKKPQKRMTVSIKSELCNIPKSYNQIQQYFHAISHLSVSLCWMYTCNVLRELCSEKN